MALLLFEPIVEKSLKITSFHHFVLEIDLSLTYLLLTLHNKNGVVKRSNHSIEDMWSTILAKIHASTYFWVEPLSVTMARSQTLHTFISLVAIVVPLKM